MPDGKSVPTKYEDNPFLSSKELKENIYKKMNKAIIISGNLAQDHGLFILTITLEAGLDIDVCMLEGKPVKGF